MSVTERPKLRRFFGIYSTGRRGCRGRLHIAALPNVDPRLRARPFPRGPQPQPQPQPSDLEHGDRTAVLLRELRFLDLDAVDFVLFQVVVVLGADHVGLRELR